MRKRLRKNNLLWPAYVPAYAVAIGRESAFADRILVIPLASSSRGDTPRWRCCCLI